MIKVILLETVGINHIGEMFDANIFKYLLNNKWEELEDLWYTEWNSLPVPLKQKHGMILWGRNKKNGRTYKLQLLGETIEDDNND